jgi:pimeloyl-ACP methyl ester carboxylesterase
MLRNAKLWLGLAALVLAARPAFAADEVRRISVNGTELAYVEAGSGQPVILVHGGLQDWRMWRDLLPGLSEGYRVIAYSRRNRHPFPVSAEGAPDGAGDLHAEDLAGLVRALGLGRAHVVGHSSGGVAALFFAAAHPDLVRSLVLNEPPATGMLAGTPDGPATLREQGARLAPAREAFAAGDMERGVRVFTDAVRGPGSFERLSDGDRRMALENAPSHVADQMSARPRAPFGCEQARSVAAPVLLTGGDRSTPLFVRVLDALERCLPNAERVTIPAAAHNVPGDNPAAFRQAVATFLGRQR